jgi:hypothetical protein
VRWEVVFVVEKGSETLKAWSVFCKTQLVECGDGHSLTDRFATSWSSSALRYTREEYHPGIMRILHRCRPSIIQVYIEKWTSWTALTPCVGWQVGIGTWRFGGKDEARWRVFSTWNVVMVAGLQPLKSGPIYRISVAQKYYICSVPHVSCGYHISFTLVSHGYESKYTALTLWKLCGMA